MCGKETRIINLYRSFNPQNETAKELFKRQLEIIRMSFTNNTVILGDMNIDYDKKEDVNYSNASLFELFDLKLGPLNLIQIVNFKTWS